MSRDLRQLRAWLEGQIQKLDEVISDTVPSSNLERLKGARIGFQDVLKHIDRQLEHKTPVSDISVPTSSRLRRFDPQTSLEAAALQTPERSRDLYYKIHGVLTVQGPATDEELIDRIHAMFGRGHTPSGIRSRRSELAKAGWVQDTGDRRSTQANSKSIVWRAIVSEPKAS